MPSTDNREPRTTQPAEAFADRLLAWFDVDGRKGLPWQRDRDPYRVWLSEVMLQQTQVATVIPYFERFIARFPTLQDLAAATDDEVMALWSGLGYYSRARNLKRTAESCVEQFGGRLPEHLDGLMNLPGIGRSTAGAILAQAHDQRHPILDGNVKRVLARHAAVAGWPGRSGVLKALWALAEEHTPNTRVADYTQAIMDLGATICLPRGPRCERCPVADDCRARVQDRVAEFPGSRPRKTLPERHAYALLVTDADRVLLERRPPSGIWGGLHALPLIDDPAALPDGAPHGHPLRHAFTHFRLTLTPVLVDPGLKMEVADRETRWARAGELADIGLPRPIRTLLNQHFEGRMTWQEQFTA